MAPLKLLPRGWCMKSAKGRATEGSTEVLRWRLPSSQNLKVCCEVE